MFVGSDRNHVKKHQINYARSGGRRRWIWELRQAPRGTRNEQTVRYMNRRSQGLHQDVSQPFIHKIWNPQNLPGRCQLWKLSGRLTHIIYGSFLAEIRSVYCPTSQSQGRNIHVNVYSCILLQNEIGNLRWWSFRKTRWVKSNHVMSYVYKRLFLNIW